MQQKIANRLGWLTAPALMADSIGRLRDVCRSRQARRFTDVVLLGMGGSSLAPEVLRAVLGVAPGWPQLRMIDSTDPAAVRSVATPPGTTLYLLASKSGTTIEPNALAAHFRDQLERAGVSRWAEHFVAITDEGTELAARARTERFRDVFINPSDIGGRYSALSLFGLVPAALMGQDVEAIVGWGLAMLDEAAAADDAASNPAVGLGMAMGAAARTGRDKATLVLPAAVRAVRPLGRAARRRKHRQAGRGHRADCGRAHRRTRRLPERSALRARPERERRRDSRRGGRQASGSRRPHRDDRRAGASGARSRIRALGDCDRGRGRDPGHQPVRRAERPAGEGRDAGPSGRIQG